MTAPEPEGLARGGNETILLVDDEEFIRELGVDVLGRAGYTVLTANNGENALELYRQERARIDLVILDLIMPGMGWQQVSRRTSHDRSTHTSIDSQWLLARWSYQRSP